MASKELLNSLRGLKRRMYLGTKITTETLWLGNAWLDKASTAEQVRRTIEKLRPRQIQGELIRVGSSGDGGYLMPDDFHGIVGCVSPGVAGEVGFDLEMAERGLKVVMADASVLGPPVSHENFNFYKKFLGTRNDDLFVRLETLVDGEFETGDLILQMDIEGAEFPVLLDTADDLLGRFRMIVLEVHDFGQLFGRFSAGLIEALTDKLTRHHAVVHIHPNNCCGSDSRYGIEIPRVLEFTFYRKDRGVLDHFATGPFPHPLDVDNVTTRASLPLPALWYRT
ncbi:FkbM family methyltransferase [Porphyrobacter sp. AAP60]|uniref:FkbM family methyltransferase n=1 Tax=Porphyrobacter sp. AAP60 TaxID=1523423 RepID=UPI0012E1770A|nr:FkbM family methyltransferase [Porphyrobacter sp. AAP60]